MENRYQLLRTIRDRVEGCDEYRYEFRPSVDLARWIDFIWYRTSRGVEVPQTYRWIPPCAGIILVFPISGQRIRTPYISSSLTRPALLPLKGVQENIGVRFRATGASKLFGFSMAELERYYYFTLADLLPGIPILEDELINTRPIEGKIAIIERFLRTLCEEYVVPDIRVGKFVELITSNIGTFNMDAVVARCNTSRRHLQRLCLRTLGLPPHGYLQAVRFVNAAYRLVHTELEISTISHTTGYSDQSHMNRQFGKYAGLTPGEFRSNTQKQVLGVNARMYPTFPLRNPRSLA